MNYIDLTKEELIQELQLQQIKYDSLKKILHSALMENCDDKEIVSSKYLLAET